MILHEEDHDGQWRFARLQPTLLSPSVSLTELEHHLNSGSNAGIYCLGPSDPWDLAASANSDPAIYWLPQIVYENASPAARNLSRAQVSNCPTWSFSTPTYSVRFFSPLSVVNFVPFTVLCI